MSSTQEAYSNTDKIVDDFAEALKDVIPDSCFVQTYLARPFPEPTKPTCPPSPLEIAKCLSFENPPTEDDETLLRTHLTLSDKERADIEEVTRPQHNCDEWKSQRCGRITASNIKRVYTRSTTLILNPLADPTAVIKEVMGDNKRKVTAAMRIGLSSEPHAKKRYAQSMRKKHYKFRTHECGMFIHPDYNFLSGSPDLRVSCECHGPGLCEIKCPSVTKGSKPTAENYSDHLVLVNGKSTLHTNSPHYFQMQFQMSVTQTKYCDYYVYVAKGQHQERIEYDQEFFESVIVPVRHFHSKYIVPELIKRSIECEKNTDNATSSQDHHYATDMPANEEMDNPCTTQSVPIVNGTISKKTPLTNPPMPPVFLCGMCGKDVPDTPDTFGQQSVQCSSCSRWIHFYCANITPDEVPSLAHIWLCDGCMVNA